MKNRLIILSVIACAVCCMAKAQTIVKIENGVSITSLEKAKSGTVPMYGDNMFPYQLSVGVSYLHQSWFRLSSNIAYLTKGGSEDIIVRSSGNDAGHSTDMQLRLNYISLNTTFDLYSRVNRCILYAGVGPRVDFKVSSKLKLADADGHSHHEKLKAGDVLAGLICIAGVDYSLTDKLSLGVKCSWQPSFNRIKLGHGSYKDNTFTVGAVVGYRL